MQVLSPVSAAFSVSTAINASAASSVSTASHASTAASVSTAINASTAFSVSTAINASTVSSVGIRVLPGMQILYPVRTQMGADAVVIAALRVRTFCN